MTNININEINYEEVAFDMAITLARQEMDRVLSSAPRLIRGYTTHLMNSTGKFIRGTSLLMCAENEEGFIHYNAIKMAAAIEIIHLATLVHDDVIDNADLRRGKVTLQKKYGRKTAVICGDYLLCEALKLAGSVSNKKDYIDFNTEDYMSKVCLGELNQHINNGNIDLKPYDYLKIISGKTAALFEASYYAGGILLENRNHELSKYKLLGHYIGMIFQLTDDCIDFEETELTAQKPVQSDYEQGVITLPLIHAFNSFHEFKTKAQSSEISRNEINQAVKLAGGISFTKGLVNRYYKKYMKTIDMLELHEEKRERLIQILNKAARLS